MVYPGGLAGSLMLNKRFEEWVKNIVGERAYIELRETNGYRLAMKQFDESIKPAFRSRDDEDQYINFPMANLKDDPSKKIKSNCITLTGFVHDSAIPITRLADSIAQRRSPRDLQSGVQRNRQARRRASQYGLSEARARKASKRQDQGRAIPPKVIL